MANKSGRWLRSKTGTRTIVGILVVIVVVVVAGYAFGWWTAVGDWLEGAARGFWKAEPITANGCVTTYQMAGASETLGEACFRSTRVIAGYYGCGDNGCYVQQSSDGLWLRTDEIIIYP